MRASAPRREATPLRARSFWIRSAGIDRLLLLGSRQYRCFAIVDRREVVQRAQAEALEEGEGRRIQDRPAGSVPAPHLSHQAPMEERAQDVIGVDAAHAIDLAARAR